MPQVERRRHQRISIRLPGVVRVAHGPEINTSLTEISEGGAQFLFSQAVSLGVKAELRFVLPLAEVKECVLYGRVQHYHEEGGKYVLGLEFTSVGDETLQAIRSYIDAHH